MSDTQPDPATPISETLAPAYPGQASQDACIAKAKPGEPQFTLLGRDPFAASLVQLWVLARRDYAAKPTTPERIQDALEISTVMHQWCFNSGREPESILRHLPFDLLLSELARRGYKATGISDESEAHPVHAAIAAMNPGRPEDSLDHV